MNLAHCIRHHHYQSQAQDQTYIKKQTNAQCHPISTTRPSSLHKKLRSNILIKAATGTILKQHLVLCWKAIPRTMMEDVISYHKVLVESSLVKDINKYWPRKRYRQVLASQKVLVDIGFTKSTKITFGCHTSINKQSNCSRLHYLQKAEESKVAIQAEGKTKRSERS